MIIPYIAQIELTNCCNAKCTFCPRSTMKRPLGFISEEVFKRAIDLISEEKEIKVIQLQGMGESFLHPKVFEFCAYAKEKCPDKSLVIITNGVLVKEIPPSLDHLIISFVGGTKEVYESMMGLSFEESVRIIKSIPEKEKITLTMLVSEENVGTIEQMKEFWSGWNVGFQYQFYNFSGAVEYKGVRQQWNNRKPCDRVYDHLLILWNGDYCLCCLDYDGTYPLGNIKDLSIRDMYNGIGLSKKREEHKRKEWNGTCKLCNYNFF